MYLYDLLSSLIPAHSFRDFNLNHNSRTNEFLLQWKDNLSVSGTIKPWTLLLPN